MAPGTHSIETAFLVLANGWTFDDGLMAWDYVVRHADSWMRDCRVIEVAIRTVPDGMPRFTFGRDVTDEAIAEHDRLRAEDAAPWVNPNAEHSTHHRGVGL